MLCTCLCAVQDIHAQVSVTLALTPPYSPRLSDYAEQPGKTILLLKNNSVRPLRVYLGLSISGDNGIVIATKPGAPPSALTLQPNQLLQADAGLLRDLFDENRFMLTKITLADLVRKNGLPEGNYEVCVQVLDYASNAPLANATSCRQIRIASLEPPLLTKPQDNEAIKYILPQSLIFSWTIPAGAEPGTRYHFRLVELLDPKKNPNDAYRNSAPLYEADVPANILVYGPAQPPLVAGRKYVWAVTALPGVKGTAYRNYGASEVHAFVVGSGATGDLVKLVYPADKAIVAPDPNPVKNMVTWDFDAMLNGNKEEPAVVVIEGNQTPEIALQNNTNIAGGKEPNKMSLVDFTKYAGKTLAWRVTVRQGAKSYSSKVQTFTILPFTQISMKELGSFTLSGFPVTVVSLHQLTGFNFAGTGTTQLYKGGPQVAIKFDKLTILPFGAEGGKLDNNPLDKPGKQKGNPPVKVFTRWVATAGTATTVERPSAKFKMRAQSDAGGTVTFYTSDIKYQASILSQWDAAKGCFVKTGSGADYALYSGRFTWQTAFLAKTKKNGDQLIAFSSEKEETFQFDYVNKFNKKGLFSTLTFDGPDGANTITPALTSNTKIKLLPTLDFDGDSTVKFQFSGNYAIAHEKKALSVDFEKQPGLSFDVSIPKGWQHMLNSDGSVLGYFDKVHVDLSKTAAPADLYRLQVPDVSLILSNKGKQFTFHFKKASFSGTTGLAFSGENNDAQQLSLMGFPVTGNNISVSVLQSALLQLKVSGDLLVPVLNQKAAVSFLADETGLKAAEMNFVAGQTTWLYKNTSKGDGCSYKANYGSIADGVITVGGAFSFSNATAGKNLNIADVQAADLKIYSDGNIGMPALAGYDQTLNHPQGNVNGFDFTANVLTLKGGGNGVYSLTIGGVATLGDNLSVSSASGNNFYTTVSFNAAEIKSDGLAYQPAPHGPSAGDPHLDSDAPGSGEIDFSTMATAGTDNESARFSGAKLKYFSQDDKYGTGFRADVTYALKSPADASSSTSPSINAVLWIGHMQAGYNYWFLEAGQKNVVIIPTGVLDLSISGFTGRVFYHMRHDGNNINDNKSYVPDDSKFMGIYGQVNLKTATDDGIKFWGDLSLEMATTSSGPEYVKMLGNGNFITSGEGSAGIMQAKDCRLEIYALPTARITGDFTGILNAANVVTVTANAGFDFSKDIFHVWGSGSGSFMGKEAPASCGFDLSDKHVVINGKFRIIDLAWHNSGIFCDDDASVTGTISLGAEVDYSPFQFKGAASFEVVAAAKECGETIISIPLSLNGQVQFPSPTCISMGVSIGPFELVMGVSDGGFIFDNCFND
ncbi:MAG: hypothetical protein EOO08_10960 [Chitinophagaceae bacterium]|nr:MAG: hypothetical protein EOO08_10960 [Chitinophagaceae bacterium]